MDDDGGRGGSPAPLPPLRELELELGLGEGQGGGGGALRALGGGELLRGLLVLQLCGSPRLVEHGGTLLGLARGLLGRRLWLGLLRATFYGHFVGGATPGEVAARAARLRAGGLRPLLALATEEQPQEHHGEGWYAANEEAALQWVGHAATTGPAPMMQLKVTSLLSASSCELLSRGVEQEGAGLSTERMAAMLEGEAPALPFLSLEQNQQLGRGLRRLDHVATEAASRGVRLLLDAEQSHVTPALELAAAGLAARHNRATPWVWGTWQAYRRDALQRLEVAAGRARGAGARLGVKLVRGAYLDWERGRGGGALLPSASATSQSYARCLELALGLVAADGAELMVATHNEGSVLQAAQRMAALGLPRAGGGVTFGQLLGMSDHVSLALGAAGYATYKSVPVGAVGQALPYLLRRAQENRAALAGAGRQRRLLANELRRRLWPPNQLRRLLRGWR